MVQPKLQHTIIVQLSIHIHTTTISLITSPHKVHCFSFRSLPKHLIDLIPFILYFQSFTSSINFKLYSLKAIIMQIQKSQYEESEFQHPYIKVRILRDFYI